MSSVMDFCRKNSVDICLGFGILSGIACTVLAVKEAPKAKKIIDELKEEKAEPIEYVKKIGPLYALPVGLGIAGVTLIFCGGRFSKREIIILSSALELSEKSFKEYRDAAIAKFGKNANKKIQDTLSENKMKENKLPTTVIMAKKGDTLCYDNFTGRYFKADIELLKQSVNELNALLLDNGEICLNDLYEKWTLPLISEGDRYKWMYDVDGLIDLYFSSTVTENTEPCLVIHFNNDPHYTR